MVKSRNGEKRGIPKSNTLRGVLQFIKVRRISERVFPIAIGRILAGPNPLWTAHGQSSQRGLREASGRNCYNFTTICSSEIDTPTKNVIISGTREWRNWQTHWT